MTEPQKRLWNLLEPGAWVLRAQVEKKWWALIGNFGFQLALSGLMKRGLIELQFGHPDHPESGYDQFMRRKTIDELAAIGKQLK